jgi:hypothetical protein
MPFSQTTLNVQLVSTLRSQISIAFSYITRANRTRDLKQLALSRRTYERAARLRKQVPLKAEEGDDIDRELERLIAAIRAYTPDDG